MSKLQVEWRKFSAGLRRLWRNEFNTPYGLNVVQRRNKRRRKDRFAKLFTSANVQPYTPCANERQISAGLMTEVGRPAFSYSWEESRVCEAIAKQGFIISKNYGL